MPYKVQVVDVTCCNSAIDPKDVEQIANTMEPQGYALAHAYIDATMSFCGNKKSLIMIFRKQ
jgi:hypothetical protein